jgi:hypothetical protein
MSKGTVKVAADIFLPNYWLRNSECGKKVLSKVFTTIAFVPAISK